MTDVCPHCGAQLRESVKRHIWACEQIELGLLALQVTPEADEKPKGWSWVKAPGSS